MQRAGDAMPKVRIHCEMIRKFDYKRIGLGVLYLDPSEARADFQKAGITIIWEEKLDTTGNRVWILDKARRFKGRKGKR